MKQYFKITHERTKKIKAKDVKVALANFIASLDKCEVREFKQHPHICAVLAKIEMKED